MGDWRNRISTLIVATIATLLIWTWAADRTREVRVLTGSVLLRPADGARQFIDPAQPHETILITSRPGLATGPLAMPEVAAIVKRLFGLPA